MLQNSIDRGVDELLPGFDMINDIIDCIASLKIIFATIGYCRAWTPKKNPNTSVAVGSLIVFCFLFLPLLVADTEIAEDAFRFVVAAGVEGNDIAERKAPLRSSEYSSWVKHS